TLGDPARPRAARVAAAGSLSTAAGLLGLVDIKTAAETALTALRGGIEPEAAPIAALLDGLGAVPILAPHEQEQLLAAFRAEAAEHIDAMTAALLALEKTRGNPRLVDGLLRQAHTLKGSAATVGLPAITEAAHELEEVLLALRAGSLGGDQVF